MFPPGHRFGPYELVALLGRGGGGDVYRARDHRLGREVAVKTVRDAIDPVRFRRLEHEARAAAALNHPNIIAVYDVGRDAGVPYIVTELLAGESLRALLRRGPLEMSRAITLACQIADGLSAAHAKGIVHRDVKPENVFVLPGGTIKLLDFGLAKLVAPDDEAAARLTTTAVLTETGQVLGTPAYLAPEQARGTAVDHRADIFSFGVVFYEMLAGQSPFGGATVADRVSAILRDPPRPLPAQLADVPGLDRFVKRCLEKDPRARFQSAGDLRFALEALPVRAARSYRLAGGAILAAVAGAAISIAAIVGSPWQLARKWMAPDLPPTATGIGSRGAEVRIRRTIDLSADLTGFQRRIASLFDSDVSLMRIDARRVEVTAAEDRMRSVLSAIKMADALSEHRFFKEPSTFAGARQSDTRISLTVKDAHVSGLLQVIAGAVGWPILVDSTVHGDVTLSMQDVPWDLVVRSCLEFRGLDLTTFRIGDVWLVTTRRRRSELAEIEPPDAVMVRSRRVGPAELARALEPARTDHGLLLINRRLDAVVIVDAVDAFADYARILATIDGTSGGHQEFPRRPSYVGRTVSLDFNETRLDLIFRLFGEMSGLNIVYEPRGTEDTFSGVLRDVRWDNALQVLLTANALVYTIDDKGLVHLIPAEKQPTSVVVETIALQQEDPAFFEAFSRYLTPRGAISSEPRSKTLVIRDVPHTVARLKKWVLTIDGRSQ